jgi:hypothetical protein
VPAIAPKMSPGTVPRRKLPPAWLLPFLKYHSTPNWKSSTSETSAMTISIITWRAATSSLRSAASMTVHSAGRRDDQQRVVVLVGDDLDVAHDAAGLAGAPRLRRLLRRGRGRLLDDDLRRGDRRRRLRLERRRRDDLPGRRARRERRCLRAERRRAAAGERLLQSGPTRSARLFCRL